MARRVIDCFLSILLKCLFLMIPYVFPGKNPVQHQLFKSWTQWEENKFQQIIPVKIKYLDFYLFISNYNMWLSSSTAARNWDWIKKWKPSWMVEATCDVDAKIFCEHVKRCGILLATDNYLYTRIFMRWHDLLWCWHWLHCNTGSWSLRWFHNRFYDFHVHRRLPILYWRNEGKQLQYILILSTIETESF